jgi:hypothetical protein
MTIEDNIKHYVYFDQNVWSHLTSLKRNDIGLYTILRNRLEGNSNLSVVYSKTNIKETLKRDIVEHIEEEFVVITEISKNNLMLQNGEVIKCNPQGLFSELNQDNYLREKLSKAVEVYIENRPIIDASLKRVQNNIPTENAVDSIINSFWIKIKGTNTNINFTQFDDITSSLRQEIKNLLIEKARNEEEKIFAIEYAQKFDSLLVAAFELGKQKTVEAMKTENGQDFLATILSVNPSKSWRISAVSGLLGAMQYWPDDKNILQKKGTDFDYDDSSHTEYSAFCKYFISNDNHLLKRVDASSKKLNMETVIVNFKKFMEMI